MALSNAWIDRIFTRLLVRYGAAWLRMWDGIPMDAVKADWADELGQLSAEAIGYALKHLPTEKPPTVAIFKALAIGRAPDPQPQLPAPKADPERVASALTRAMAGVRSSDRSGSRAWAKQLREREESGEKLTLAQRGMRRAAMAGQEVADASRDFLEEPCRSETS